MKKNIKVTIYIPSIKALDYVLNEVVKALDYVLNEVERIMDARKNIEINIEVGKE